MGSWSINTFPPQRRGLSADDPRPHTLERREVGVRREHLGWAGRPKALCGVEARRHVIVEPTENVCKTCLKIACKLCGDHWHWMPTMTGWMIRWPRLVYISGMPGCCDLRPSSSNAVTFSSAIWSIVPKSQTA